MVTSPDYYEVLQVSPNADPEVIQAAYRRLSMRWHAEERPGGRGADRQILLLNEAYAVLSDALKRREYDVLRRQAATGSGSGDEPSNAGANGDSEPNAGPRQPAAPFCAPDSYWYVLSGGDALGPLLGPFTAEEIKAKAAAGSISPDDCVCQGRHNRQSGLRAKDVEFLRDIWQQTTAKQGGAPGGGTAGARSAAQGPPDPQGGEANTAAWIIFAVGLCLFAVAYGRYLLTTPLLVVGGICIWGAVFGIPGYLCSLYRKRTGMTVVASLFLLAAGLQVVSETTAGPDALPTRVGTPQSQTKPADRTPESAPVRDAQPHIQSGQVWLEQGDYERAIRDLSEAVKLDPNNRRACSLHSLAYSARAVARFNRQDFEAAIEDCDAAILFDAENALAYATRGGIWYAKSEYEKAIADLDVALRLDPKIGYCYADRGGAWFHKRNFDKAIRDLDEAIRLNPEQLRPYVHRGTARLMTKEYSKAVSDFDEAIRLDPKEDFFYGSRGTAKLEQGAYDEARKDLDEAIRLDPKKADFYSLRGRAWSKLREPGKATKDLEKAHQLDPANY